MDKAIEILDALWVEACEASDRAHDKWIAASEGWEKEDSWGAYRHARGVECGLGMALRKVEAAHMDARQEHAARLLLSTG